MLKKALLTISLEILLNACSSLPPFPDINQCALRANGLYCVTKQTHVRTFYPISSNEAFNAQCMPVNDKQQSYQQAENWVSSIEQLANQRCH